MRLGSLCFLVVVGCSSGSGELGDACSSGADCTSSLQCLAGVCAAHCQRATECGDGYSCDEGGICRLATGEQGDACSAEDTCAPGLACEIDGSATDDTGHLTASCVAQNMGHPPTSECDLDTDCRNGTCALGHCVDLCAVNRDCGAGLDCMDIPRIDPFHTDADGKPFRGCLPNSGNLTWTIPVASASDALLLPIPAGATSVSVMMTVDDPNQLVGVTSLAAPAGTPLAAKNPLISSCIGTSTSADCNEMSVIFHNPVRQFPELAQSVLAMPSSPDTELVEGAYAMTVSSLRQTANGWQVGSAVPHVTAVIKMDSSVLLDLHFFFLNLEDHPCADALGGTQFDATTAQHATGFQTDYLSALRDIFAHGGLSLGSVTYEDVKDHPDLDGLDSADLPSLLALGHYPGGINVFFVRTLSPVGIQALGPNPGPAGLAGTRQSGIVVGIDSLCYRSWSQVARLTAHEVARYMGLYHNVETQTDAMMVPFVDPIGDSDQSPDNLMFYSELPDGTMLSPGQRDVLTRSPVLR